MEREQRELGQSFSRLWKKSKEKETQDYRRRRMKQVPKRTRGPRKDTETEGSSYYIWPLPDSFCSVSDEAGCRSYPRIFFYLCKTWRFFLFCLSFDSPWPACTPSKTSSTQGRRGLFPAGSQGNPKALHPLFPFFQGSITPMHCLLSNVWKWLFQIFCLFSSF